MLRVLADAARACRAEPVPAWGHRIGWSTTGRPLWIDLRTGVLVGGLPGSGKSGTLRTIAGGLVADPSTVLVIIDGKGGADLGPVHRRAAAVATRPADVRPLLTRLVELVEDRAAELGRTGRVLWHPTPDRPRIVVIVDELAAVLGANPDLVDPLARIAALGRAVSIVPVLATQRPSSDTIPTRLRELLPSRIAHAVMRAEDSRMVLGIDGAEDLPSGRPGACLVVAPGLVRPVAGRVDRVDLEDLAEIVARAPTASWELPSASTAPEPLDHPDRPANRPTAPLTDRDLVLSSIGSTRTTVPALARLTGLPDRRVRAVLTTAARDGLVVRLDGSGWLAAPPMTRAPQGPGSTPKAILIDTDPAPSPGPVEAPQGPEPAPLPHHPDHPGSSLRNRL